MCRYIVKHPGKRGNGIKAKSTLRVNPKESTKLFLKKHQTTVFSVGTAIDYTLKVG